MVRHLVFLFAAAAVACLLGAREASADFPCPPDEQILPCTCKDTTTTMDLDCSAVANATQLMNIFHSTPPFPFDHFTMFRMNNNMNVEELSNGVFNTIKFDEIEIKNGALKEVDQGSLQESYDTLKKAVLSGNQIERFLMNDEPDMSMFKKIEHLDLGGNQIGVFPDITSDTLKELYMNKNPVEVIHDENLMNVPHLEKIDISEINLKIVETKLLSYHKQLKYIYLHTNELTDIEATALKVESPDLKEIHLNNNQISDVEPGAFDLLEGLRLNLDNNQLVQLAEATWAELIRAKAYLTFNGNPLDCGCDIAWAIAPPEDDDTVYISSMEGTCPLNNNVTFSELKPEWYENFCNTQK